MEFKQKLNLKKHALVQLTKKNSKKKRGRPSKLRSLYKLSNSNLNLLCLKVNPCKVVLHRLSPQFIQDALKGNIKWKRISRKHLDVENYLKNSRVKTKAENMDQVKKRYKFISKNCNNGKKIENFLIFQDLENSDIKQNKRRYSRKLSSGLIYKCKQCFFSTNNSEHLLFHIGIHKYHCKLCNLTFENNCQYQNHNYEFHKPVIDFENNIVYGCKNCPIFFYTESSAKTHLKSHMEAIENGKFFCPFCKTTFSQESTIFSHLMYKHLHYKCTFCNFLAINFDTLERHSKNLHSFYGKPFECNICEFRSASFGGLTVHKKSHGIEWKNETEYCKFCSKVLIDNREFILEHLANHINCTLFECLSCDFKTNSFDLIRNHGIDYHATHEISRFANMMDLDEAIEKIKNFINISFNEADKETERERTKPTNCETENAVADLSIDSLYSNFNSINSNVLENDFNLITQYSYDNIENSQVTNCANLDPVSVEMASTFLCPTINDYEVFLTIDPITGQLSYGDSSLVDEKGNNIHIAIENFSSKQNSNNTSPVIPSNNLSVNMSEI